VLLNWLKRRSLTQAGRRCWRQREYTQSIHWYEEALALDRSLWGDNHLHVAQDYDNIDVAYRGMGELARAMEYYQKAIAILETISTQHIFLPTPYNHMGIACAHNGDYGRAVEYHEKALFIQRKWAGPMAKRVTKTTETLLGSARAKLEREQRAPDQRLVIR